MHESKMRSMQRLAAQSGKFAAQRLGKLSQLGFEARTVKRIADQGMADRAQMHAHLMRAPGLERAFEQRGDLLFSAAQGRDRAPMGHSLASPVFERGHLGPARWMASDRRIDHTLRSVWRAPHEGEIAALELAGSAMVGELRCERMMCLVGLAMTMSPLVSLSRRCTMPGLATPPIPERLAPQCAISALTSVPVAWPAPGCTTRPAGLS